MRRSPEYSSSTAASPPPRVSRLRHNGRRSSRNCKRHERSARSNKFSGSDGFSKASTSSKQADPHSGAAFDSDPDRGNRSSRTEANSSNPSRSGPCVNVATLPVFRGRSDECPLTHLSRFRKVCRANNAGSVEMMMRIFPVTLEDEAALWFDMNIEPYFQSFGWEDIKTSFSEAYGKHREVSESELMLIFQREDESVRSYMLRFQFLLRRNAGNGLSDSALRSVFVDGLREDIRNSVVEKRPESLEDALRLAFDYEKANEIRAAWKVVIESRNGVSASVAEMADELARCASIGSSSLGLK